MDDFLGSVRRSLVFWPSPPPPPSATVTKPIIEDYAPPIRWRKGELIGCGSFGHVYMAMNQDSGELLAVKQVDPFTSYQ